MKNRYTHVKGTGVNIYAAIIVVFITVMICLGSMATTAEETNAKPKNRTVYVYQNQPRSKELHRIITCVLKDMDLYSEDAVYLLMYTAAVESNMGELLKQVGGGARGIFQMSPKTEADIWEYLRRHPDLKRKVEKYRSGGCPGVPELEFNLVYAIAMARIHYKRDRYPIPHRNDPDAVYKYYKRVWNTHGGAATRERNDKKLKSYLDG